MPEILNKSHSTEDLGSEGHSNRASTNPSPTLDNVLTKHPLQNQWTLWYYKLDRNKNWEDNQKMVNYFSQFSNLSNVSEASYNYIFRSQHFPQLKIFGHCTTTSNSPPNWAWVVTTRYSKKASSPCGKTPSTKMAEGGSFLWTRGIVDNIWTIFGLKS